VAHSPYDDDDRGGRGVSVKAGFYGPNFSHILLKPFQTMFMYPLYIHTYTLAFALLHIVHNIYKSKAGKFHC